MLRLAFLTLHFNKLGETALRTRAVHDTPFFVKIKITLPRVKLKLVEVQVRSGCGETRPQ